jgi:hypothetical protein
VAAIIEIEVTIWAFSSPEHTEKSSNCRFFWTLKLTAIAQRLIISAFERI